MLSYKVNLYIVTIIPSLQKVRKKIFTSFYTNSKRNMLHLNNIRATNIHTAENILQDCNGIINLEKKSTIFINEFKTKQDNYIIIGEVLGRSCNTM
jgi:hypothetical protein